jgi:hypothetical protein
VSPTGAIAALLAGLGAARVARAQDAAPPELDVRDAPGAAEGCVRAAAVIREAPLRAPALERGPPRAWRDAWFSLEVTEDTGSTYLVAIWPVVGKTVLDEPAGRWPVSAADCDALPGYIAERAWSWLQTSPALAPRGPEVHIGVTAGAEPSGVVGGLDGQVRLGPGAVRAALGLRLTGASSALEPTVPRVERWGLGLTGGVAWEPADVDWSVLGLVDAGPRWVRQGGSAVPLPEGSGWPPWLLVSPRLVVERRVGSRWVLGAELGGRLPRLSDDRGWAEAPGWIGGRVGWIVVASD